MPRRVTESFIVKLHSHLYQINKIEPRLNKGGCAIFASEVYYRLRKMGYKPKIYVLDLQPEDMKQKVTEWRYAYKNKASTHLPMGDHCCIKLGMWFFDSKYLIEATENKKLYFDKEYDISGTISWQNIKYLVRIRRLWNTEFPRRNIPKIKNFIKEQFVHL